jgi:hypothetical protein
MLFDKGFSPESPQVFDDVFCLYDDRTKPEPFGMLVDAIAQNNYGLRPAPLTPKWADLNIEHAAWEFESYDKSTHESRYAFVALGVLRLLFAIHCLHRVPPVMLVAPSVSAGLADNLRRQNDRLLKVTQTLAACGVFYPNDEHAARKLRQVRSWNWSANVPGIVIFVNVDTSPQD